MEPVEETEDERMLRERNETLRNDRREQARWYEKLNLFAEALRIYESIDDNENIIRLKEKMKNNYGSKARELESQGRYQEAANLYYLIGDHASVGRMKKLKPDILILYDDEGEGLKQLATSLDEPGQDEGSDLFRKPNFTSEEEKPPEASGPEHHKETKGITGKKGVPVKMPKKRRKRFCPYCGEEITTRKEPRFCPFCGEELE